MFWPNYIALCEQEKKTPSGLAKELGISSGTVTGWKNNKIPSESSLQKIADHFHLDKWDLLSDKITATICDGNSVSSSDELNDYAGSLFIQLNIKNRVQAITELESLLRGQLAQGVQKESD